jgi:hypothetical protein
MRKWKKTRVRMVMTEADDALGAEDGEGIEDEPASSAMVICSYYLACIDLVV